MKLKMKLKLNEIEAACILEGIKLLPVCYEETALRHSYTKEEVWEACKNVGLKMKDELEKHKSAQPKIITQ